METFLIKTFQLLLALSILVLVHEFGHYIFSRIFGVKVEKFYMFFHPWFKICKYNPGKPKGKWSFFCPNDSDDDNTASDGTATPATAQKATWRDTEYGIGWLPLGGYCKIAGMIDESMDREQMAQEPKPWEFRARPSYQRLFIMVGGVLFNFILAIAIYSGIVFSYGEEFITFDNATEGMSYCDSAHMIGLQDGDIPLQADGTNVSTLDDMAKILTAKTLVVLRNKTEKVKISVPGDFVFRANDDAEKGQNFMAYRLPVYIKQLQPGMGAIKSGLQEGDHITAVNGKPAPEFEVFSSLLKQYSGKTVNIAFERKGKISSTPVEIDDNGKIGIGLCMPTEVFKTVTKKYNIFQSIPRGIALGCDRLTSYVSSLKLVFTKEGAQSLGGFGSLGSIFPDKWNWLTFWYTTAFFSVILAVMNILPIPALDGGHVLFLLWEIITRRKPSEKFLERAQIAGMAFLFALLLFANGNDIYRFFLK